MLKREYEPKCLEDLNNFKELDEIVDRYFNKYTLELTPIHDWRCKLEIKVYERPHIILVRSNLFKINPKNIIVELLKKATIFEFYLETPAMYEYTNRFEKFKKIMALKRINKGDALYSLVRESLKKILV